MFTGTVAGNDARDGVAAPSEWQYMSAILGLSLSLAAGGLVRAMTTHCTVLELLYRRILYLKAVRLDRGPGPVLGGGVDETPWLA